MRESRSTTYAKARESFMTSWRKSRGRTSATDERRQRGDGKGDLCHEDKSVVVACLDDGLDDVTRSFYREDEGRLLNQRQCHRRSPKRRALRFVREPTRCVPRRRARRSPAGKGCCRVVARCSRVIPRGRNRVGRYRRGRLRPEKQSRRAIIPSRARRSARTVGAGRFAWIRSVRSIRVCRQPLALALGSQRQSDTT
jgi:hypothetical protein